MRADEPLLAGGSYARNQLFCKDRLVAWSHQRRFAKARALVMPFRGRRLLDYGCGDATFLWLVRDLFPDALGADADPKQGDECSRRLTDTLRAPEHAGRYGVVVRMGCSSTVSTRRPRRCSTSSRASWRRAASC
jgi:hypothetical protein